MTEPVDNSPIAQQVDVIRRAVEEWPATKVVVRQTRGRYGAWKLADAAERAGCRVISIVFGPTGDEPGRPHAYWWWHVFFVAPFEMEKDQFDEWERSADDV